MCFIGCFRYTSARQTTLQWQRWRVASKYTSPASFTGRPILLWSASKAVEKIHTVQTKSEEVKKREESTDANFPDPCRKQTEDEHEEGNRIQGNKVKASSACLFQVLLRKGEYILQSWRTTCRIIILFCEFFSNTILPTFRYWKIKIPIYSLYKKEAFKSTRNKGQFFFSVLLFFLFLHRKCR